MSESLLEVADLSVAFGGVAALTDVDLRVQPGTIHGLIGPNGAGKTTLLNAITRLVRPQKGSVRFDGVDLLARAPHEVAGLRISRTFQNFGLVGELPVLENVMVGLHPAIPTGLVDELFRIARRNSAERHARERAQAALSELGLAQVASVPVASLSYGTRKAVELARAIALDPRLLLLDEPTAGLSRNEMDALRDTLLALRRRTGVTIVVITHHIEFLLGVADAVTVLDLGRCIADGAPSLVREDPAVVAAYVGAQA